MGLDSFIRDSYHIYIDFSRTYIGTRRLAKLIFPNFTKYPSLNFLLAFVGGLGSYRTSLEELSDHQLMPPIPTILCFDLGKPTIEEDVWRLV